MKQPPAVSRASINDVAVHAGVSAQTVSRVANGRDNVRPATRERVQASMRALGYRPNSAARNLKSGRFRSIGFVTFNLATVGNTHRLDAVSAAAEAAGYTTTLLSVEVPTHHDVVRAFGRLDEQAVDGIILVVSTEVGSLDDLGVAAGLPLVVVDSDADLPYSVIDTDQEQGARIAVEHLIELGHREIVHVSGPATSLSAQRRIDGYRRALAAASLAAPPVVEGDWSTASGLRIGRRIVASDPPTAIFAGNDQMALGILHAIHEKGLRVPDDISVVGFDDLEEAQAYWPALTTVHQDFDEVGRRATELLLTLIEQPSAERRKHLLPTRLVVRASTGPVRTA